jgi:preprotein translocase subunit YajC
MKESEKKNNIWPWLIVIAAILVGVYLIQQKHQENQNTEWLDKTTKAHSACYEDVRKGAQTMATCGELGTDGHTLMTDHYYQKYLSEHR